MDEILSLLSSPMAIHPDHFNSLKLALFSAVSNGDTGALAAELKKEQIETRVVSATGSSVVDGSQLGMLDVPADSVAVFILEGVIYPWKTYALEQYLKDAISNPNIIGIVFFVNTPGGYTHRVDIISDLIRDCEKPTAACVTGMCASAGMWLFSGSDRMFYSSKLDVFGSIGVMTTYTNLKEFWEKMGVIDVDIYASLSTEKNKESREAEAGNYEPIVNQLDYINTAFHESVSANLGLARTGESGVFSGATYFSEEARSLGLVDELRDMDGAVAWVVGEAMKRRANAMY